MSSVGRGCQDFNIKRHHMITSGVASTPSSADIITDGVVPPDQGFLTTLGERLTGTSGDLREMSYLFQRLSVIVQRFNSVLIHESFVSELDMIERYFYFL